ncbi:MAG: undecaprenyl/decaprenyl-phosphate alpha-N-acetylglucosaminyl 1-phosphate transferase [Candidatus Amulumruptor caecigallinarius]|nr:undecaprenyl/decaprenyl-phosphate alpha-N-acetylglucosaminyl 1-phosphate transferase [Candidatus Amulumruptor caecigallinarius]
MLEHWFANYMICLVLAVLLTGMIIPNIMKIAFKKKLFDEVNERKIHHGVVPRLGGISFLPAFMFAFCCVIGFNIRIDAECTTDLMTNVVMPLFFLLCAMMLLYLVGIADDLVGVRYRAKFLFQIIAGCLIVISGTWINSFYGFLRIEEIPSWLGWLITIFSVIYVTNAINLIDGIDGLASGLSIMALAFYSVVFFGCGEYIYALLAGATLGTLIPFFYFNVFGKAERHNKIFMGDTGSLTIGLVMSFLSIEVFNIQDSALANSGNLMVLAIAPIIVPCFDVVRVFIHRVRRKKNPFLPDKCHIHHKLLALGWNQKQALVSILLTDCAFILANYILSGILNPTVIIVGDIIIWSAMNILLTAAIRKREKAFGVTLYE